MLGSGAYLAHGPSLTLAPSAGIWSKSLMLVVHDMKMTNVPPALKQQQVGGFSH